jgi:hypothetical protein
MLPRGCYTKPTSRAGFLVGGVWVGSGSLAAVVRLAALAELPGGLRVAGLAQLFFRNVHLLLDFCLS